MKANILPALVLALLSQACQIPISRIEATTDEDAELYLALVSRFPPPEGKYYLVDNEYSVPSDVNPRITDYLEETPKELIEELATLKADLSDNFPALPENSMYRALTHSKKKQLKWGTPAATESIQTNYPDNHGTIHFSKSVFSPDAMSAVLYREFYIGDHGDGAVFYFKKIEGKWTVVDGMDIWRASW